MAAPTRVVTGDTAVANDLNQLIDLLEGASSLTEAWKLVSSSGENFIVKLSDAAGARKFSIQDSAGVEVASIDSDGGATFSSVTASGAFSFPVSTSPTQTADGAVFWDSDDDVLTVGTGAANKRVTPYVAAGAVAAVKGEIAHDLSTGITAIHNGTAAVPIGQWVRVAANQTAQATTSTAAVDLLTLTASPNIGINDWALLYFEFRKTATNAQSVGFGLKINATTVMEASVVGFANQVMSSATNRAEAGYAYYVIPPRSSANYGFGIVTEYICFTTAGAIARSTQTQLAAASPPTDMTAAVPNAAITSVTIRAINGTSNNNAEVKNAALFVMKTGT